MQGRFEPITIQTKPPQLELSAGSLKSLLLRWEDNDFPTSMSQKPEISLVFTSSVRRNLWFQYMTHQ